jgi:hypothetical protein
MSFLVEQPGVQDLIISKEGDGRLYYRLGLRYAPTDLGLDPLDMGFVVQRTYEAVDDPADVRRDEDGVWHIKAGARVRVRLTMVATNRRYHVALVDRLPAGLEIINPDLAVSERRALGPERHPNNGGWWWWGPWYDHQNLRDAGAEAFTTLPVGWRLQLQLRRTGHHAGRVRRPAGQGRRDVFAGGLRAQRQRQGDCGVGVIVNRMGKQ